MIKWAERPEKNKQNLHNNYVKYLKDFNFINDREKSKLTTYTSTAPKLYGLPKIHKLNLPLRPIVSFINSPSYNLSKFLVNILNNITINSKYNIKNSLHFKDKISEITMDTGEILVSFDVVSLFTNVPMQLCLEILERGWNRISTHTDIPKKKFLDMLSFCFLDNNYFSFNGNYYKQIFGTPMGSPLSPILADIVMEDLLDSIVQKLDFKIKLIVKYVDDLFFIIPEETLTHIHNLLNDYHEKLQFTVEKQKNGSLAFLDTRISVLNDKLMIDWYQKEMASGRLLNFFSNHPKYQVVNTARNFIRRVLGISSNIYHSKNKDLILKILKDNQFPEKTILRLINDFYFNKQPNTNVSGTTEPTKYVSTTYIPKLSDNIKQQIKKYTENTNVAFKTDKTVNTLFSKLKDKTKKELFTDLVYEIPCGGNTQQSCNLRYIGTTKQFLKNRLSNHKSDIKCNNPNKTALSKHSLDLKHTPKFDMTKILTVEKNVNKRLILESLYIQTSEKTMNRKTDIENISDIYCSLLNNFKYM